jgi:hypothetical protein
LAVAQHLPQGRSQAGDRHLNFHETRDNLHWYALPIAAVDAADEPWERRRRLHSTMVRSAVRAHDGNAVASHHSALVERALPAYAADLRQVHLTRTADSWSRRRRGLTVHGQISGATVTDGVIAPAIAVAQAGCVNGPMAGLIAADAALRIGLVTEAGLSEAGARMQGPGSPWMRRMLAHADGRAESPGETRLRYAVQVMGYAVTPQVPVVDGTFRAVVDLLLDDWGVVVEFDGFVKYGRRDALLIRATSADVLVAEKIREITSGSWAMKWSG